VDAQYNLGVCLRRGLGVPANDARAERCYRSAAENGQRSAQLALGSLLEPSARTDQEWREVARWYRMAADAEHPAAMMALGKLHESGRGVDSSRHAALALYQRALAAGYAEAAPDVRRLQGALATTEVAGLDS
jgi:hypothetical protein